MRRIAFDPDALVGDDRDFWTNWRSDADDETSAMHAQHVDGETPSADRDAIWGRLKRWLAEHAFANKCAYCEGDISAHAPQHAEHWRPKARVTMVGSDDTEARVERDGKPHPGYWWLAYDWQNIVPACDYCNTAGAKGTKFPIAGTYAFGPEEGIDVHALDAIERPLLLHPYGPLDPRDHIGFWHDGTAYARDKSPHGYWTIKTMGLNREALVNARQKRQNEALDAFGQAASDAVRFGTDLTASMEGWSGDRAPYSTAVSDRLRAAWDGLGKKLAIF